jgi:hypothetical protein
MGPKLVTDRRSIGQRPVKFKLLVFARDIGTMRE